MAGRVCRWDKCKLLSRCNATTWFDIVTARQISFGDLSSVTENLRQLQTRMQKPLNEVKIIRMSVIWKEDDLKYVVDNKSLFLKTWTEIYLWESRTSLKENDDIRYSKLCLLEKHIICKWDESNILMLKSQNSFILRPLSLVKQILSLFLFSLN